MTKNALLITGATGQQGGFVVKALTELSNAQDFTILAATRNPDSPSAQRLLKHKNLKLVKGDMLQADALFRSANEAIAGTDSKISAVFSVQTFMGKGQSIEQEEVQAKALIDAAKKAGIQQFVQTSVDRGGDVRSDTNPTYVPHFASKHRIEQYLKATNMNYTILRPVAFMDNLQPGMQTKVFLAALQLKLGDKPLQWIAVSDIGWFAAQALTKPEEYHNKAIGLAGDSLNLKEIDQAFRNATGSPAPVAFGILGRVFTMAVKEIGLMIKWFGEEGYGADIDALRKIHPELKTLETWLKTEGKF